MSLKKQISGRKGLILLIGVALLLVGFGAWLLLRGDGLQTVYTTTVATRGELRSTVTSSGTLNAVVSVSVGTAVSGTIKKLYVDYNSHVKKGQVIAQIDPAPFRAQVEQSRGSYLTAVANVAKARAALTNAEKTEARYGALVRDGSVARNDYDTYATAARTAKAELAAARGDVVETKGSYDQAKTNLAYSTIHSPVDGIIISRAVEEGQTVAASYSTPTLFTIAQDLRKMQINATVDESDIGQIREGENATFTVDAYPDDTFAGNVRQVRNAFTTTSNVVTYTVVLDAANPDLRLKPGMTTNITFVTAVKKNVLRIPTAALRYKPAGVGFHKTAKSNSRQKRVYVLKNGRPVPVDVTIGIGNDQETEVTGGGLVAGDEVITAEQTGVKVPDSANPFGGGRSHGRGMGRMLR